MAQVHRWWYQAALPPVAVPTQRELKEIESK